MSYRSVWFRHHVFASNLITGVVTLGSRVIQPTLCTNHVGRKRRICVLRFEVRYGTEIRQGVSGSTIAANATLCLGKRALSRLTSPHMKT